MKALSSTIGLTGGIGSGKSVVARLLRTLGVPVYDCDSRAKRLTLTHAAIRNALTELLGPDVYLNEGKSLNKKLMADYLFRSSENANRINAIIHPVVRSDFQQWANEKRAQGYGPIALESAILYESGFHTLTTEIWQVEASMETRLQRIVARDGLTQEEALRKIEFQLRNQPKVLTPPAKVVENDINSALLPQVTELLSHIQG